MTPQEGNVIHSASKDNGKSKLPEPASPLLLTPHPVFMEKPQNMTFNTPGVLVGPSNLAVAPMYIWVNDVVINMAEGIATLKHRKINMYLFTVIGSCLG